MKNRSILSYLKQKSKSKLGRIITLTGARQTGKTTLVQSGFPDYTYISLEDPVVRPEYTALSAPQWRENFPKAILDEDPFPAEDVIKQKMGGNLCRCTGYRKIVTAIMATAEKSRDQG